MLGSLPTLVVYNARIVLASGYWLLIIPLVASQLVLFWHMATTTLVTTATVMRTFELLIPVLAAFMCAHVFVPEHRERVDEITFVRPMPFGRTILLRVLLLWGIAAALGAVMLYVYAHGLKKEFSAGDAVLASIPPTLFLSMLSLGLAGAWRTPAVGIGAALVLGVVDAWRGPALNPLLTLQSYAAAIQAGSSPRPADAQWMLSKGALVLLAVVTLLLIRRSLGQPPSPHRWRSALRLALGTVVCAALYLGTGARWQLHITGQLEAAQPEQARLNYQRAFAGYGPLPAAWLCGADFAAYVGYAPWTRPNVTVAERRAHDVSRLLALVERWPNSPWADNALFEVIRLSSTQDMSPEEAARTQRWALQLARMMLDRYPQSPFAPRVAVRMIRLASALNDEKTVLWAYQRAVSVYQDPHSAGEAAAELRAHYLARNQIGKAIAAARDAVEKMPVELRPKALMDLAGLLAQNGRRTEARQAYMELERAVPEALAALGLTTLDLEAGEEQLRRRSELLLLRTQARKAIAVLDGKAPPPAPPTPPPH